MLNVFKKVFGTKYDRDVKQYQGLIGEINNNFQSYQSLSNDELRNKTHEFKQKIADYLSEIDEEIKSSKSNAGST